MGQLYWSPDGFTNGNETNQLSSCERPSLLDESSNLATRKDLSNGNRASPLSQRVTHLLPFAAERAMGNASSYSYGVKRTSVRVIAMQLVACLIGAVAHGPVAAAPYSYWGLAPMRSNSSTAHQLPPDSPTLQLSITQAPSWLTNSPSPPLIYQ